MNVYNSKTRVNKGLSKSTRAKNIVAQRKKERRENNYNDMSGAEKLLNIYDGRDIDLRNPDGYYLMNSGFNLKGAIGLSRKESKELTKLMDDLFQNDTFVQLAQATTSPSEIMERAVDLNEKLFASTAQKTKTFSSINDLKESYKYLKEVQENKGKMFIFDTETIGGKNRTGIWNPLAITEYAMQEYDFNTGETISTNIVLGIADNAENERVYNEIIKYMDTENWQAIEQNEELFVTASRMGLYADADMELDPNTGYYKITRLGEKTGDWKSKSKFEQGWKKLRDVYKTTELSENGLKKSDQAYFDAIVQMQTQMNSGNAIALGQNFQIFDEPVVNTQLKRTFKYYQEILDDKTGSLAGARNISKEQAKSAVDYMQKQLDSIGGGLNLANKKTFDTLPLFKVIRDTFGINTLLNGNQDVIKKAGAGFAKQEFVGEAWFQDLFSDAMAHMADFDVTVLNYAATKELQQTGGLTLLDYLMTKAGNEQTGIIGINDKARAIKTGQVFYSKGGTGSFDYAGKGLLNFTHNEKTGEIFTSAGYKFVNGKSLGYEENKINMGTNLTKGQFYTLESLKKVKSSDIHSELGNVMPDMSGTDFIVAKFKMALPEGEQSDGLEYISHNFIFNSEKQFAGFMSSNLNMALDFDENGELKIVEGMENLFDMIDFTPDGEPFRMTEIFDMKGQPLSEKDMIQHTLKNATEKYKTTKSYQSIINSDDAYKKTQKILNAKSFLQNYSIDKDVKLGEVTADELNNLLNGKSIRNLDQSKTDFLQSKLREILGFKNRKLKETILYSNTQRNVVNTWEYMQKHDKFFSTVLQTLNEEAKARNWNDRQKSIAFNDLVETMRVQAAELLSTGDAKQDKYRITGRKKAIYNAQQVMDTYDIKLPNNFSIDNSSRILNIDSYSSSDYRDILRFNLGNDSESFNLINKLRNAMYGEKKPLASTDTLNRTAMNRFLNDVIFKDESFAPYKATIKDMIKDSDYNVNQVATEIINSMKAIKQTDMSAGILRELDIPTLNDEEAMVNLLNSTDFEDLIKYNVKHNLINPIDSKKLLNTKDGMKNFVKNDIMKFYMPDKKEFGKTLIGLTDDQRFVKTKLYDTLYEDISAQLTDILTIGSKIKDGDMFISPEGEIFFNRHGSSVEIKGVPKIKMNNGHLYGVIGNQELNLHLELGYTKGGSASIHSNLGHIFNNNRYVSKNIKRKIDKNEFQIDDFLNFTNKLAEEFREEATYSGTSGELWSNYFVGTKELNKVLPQIFADEGSISLNFMEDLNLPEHVKAKLRDKYNKEWESLKGKTNEELMELDPAFKQIIGPYRVNIMRELANQFNIENTELLRLIDGLNFSTKDKSKAGKDILMGANTRFHVGFLNPLDENSRPVIGGAGNVFYLEEEKIRQAANKIIGIKGPDALFESNETLYINKAYKEGIGQTVTSFSGRTAYVGEIGIRTIINNNFDTVMNNNSVEFNSKEQREKIYKYLNSFVNTFEQARVFSAEAFDEVTGGTMAADKQVLSLSKDIASTIDLDDPEKVEKLNDLYSVKGKIIRADDGTLAYISSNGKIVKHGDAIIPYSSYGGSESNWIVKLQKGVLGYEVTDKEKNVLSDKGISKLLNKYSNLFEGIDPNDEITMNKIFEDILKKENLKANFVVEDINKTTLPKILVNDAEKSMNHLGYMRIGTVNDSIAGVLAAYGDETKELIGTAVPTEKALRAYFKDENKAKTVLSAFNFKSMDDFLKAVKEESYTADRILFGEQGIFKGFVSIGNDNLSGHGNKGSIFGGAIDEAISMLGKYENNGIENIHSRELGLEKFKNLVNNNEDFKFFKNKEGVGYNFKIVNGSLMLEDGRELQQGLYDADVLDVKRIESLIEHINDEYLIKNGASKEDQLVHYLPKRDERNNIILDEDGKEIIEKTIGRVLYAQDAEGKWYINGSVGTASMKIVRDSEKQSGMNAEFVEVKQKIQELKEQKATMVNSIKGRRMNEFELEAAMILDGQIENLERRALDLSETGHLYEFGDRERNILSQAILNEDVLEHANVNSEAARANEAIRGMSKERYSKDHQVFSWLEDELTGQAYYNRYEESLLTKDMLKSKKYAHLKTVYEDIVEGRGKNLGVENAENIYGIRMIDMANKYNNNIGGLTHTDLEKAGFTIMSPMEYSESFSNIGIDKENAVVKKNILIDLGEEFDTMPGWEGKRYVAVPGMGAVIGDADIKKEWHTAAKAMASVYENQYMDLHGQETMKVKQTLDILQKKVDDVATATSTYTKKKNLADQRAKRHVYAAMDRTKLMSLPDENNPLLEQAMVHGKSIAEWQKQGIYYDAVFDSYEQFEKRGFFREETLKKFGMEDKKEMVEYLKTHGATMMDDRYPNIRDTSLTTARHYLMDGDYMHATNAAYTTKETMLKILGDSDGDSASRFLLEYKGVSHAQYEHARINAIKLADEKTFMTDELREKFIKQQVIDSGIDEQIYDSFRDVDTYAYTEATTINKLYHQRAVDTNWDDFEKTRKAQSIISGGKPVIAEYDKGKSILSREKLLALNYDPTFKDVDNNIKEVNRMFTILQNNIDQIDDENIKKTVSGFTSILDYKDEIKIMDDALYAMESINAKNSNIISDDLLSTAQNAVKQRVRIGSYHSEILSKLGISAVGNVNFAFFGATQAIKNYYGVPGASLEERTRARITTAMGYEAEQASISSKKVKLKAGDTRVVDLNEILREIQNSNGNIGNDFDNIDTIEGRAMAWMRESMDQKKAVAQYQNIISKYSLPDNVKFDVNDKASHAAIADYMYKETIKGYAEVYRDSTMRKMATAYSRVATNGANPHAIEYAQGMLNNSFLGMAAEDITNTEGKTFKPDVSGTVNTEDGKRIIRSFEQNATDEAIESIKKGTGKIKKWATSDLGANSAGKALALGVLGLAGGLIASGYASGNPLNDANPEQVVQQQTNNKMSFGPDTPQFAPNNTGGYIINIKGDTRKGNRQLKKALKQAASSSVGGGVNINMSLKTSREGGYSDKDIENILSNYF